MKQTRQVRKSTTQETKKPNVVQESTNNKITERKEMCEDLNSFVELTLEKFIQFVKSQKRTNKTLIEAENMLYQKSNTLHETNENLQKCIQNLQKRNKLLTCTLVVFALILFFIMPLYISIKCNTIRNEVRKELYDEIKEQVLIDLAPKLTLENKKNNTAAIIKLSNMATEYIQEKKAKKLKVIFSSTVAKNTNNTVVDELQQRSDSKIIEEKKKLKIDISTKKAIFLYKKNSYESKIIGTIPSNEKLTVIKLEDNGWLKVKYKNKTGWIFYLYTDFTKRAGKAIQIVEEYRTRQKGFVNADYVNVRKHPSITSNVLDKLSKKKLKVVSLVKFFPNEPYGWFLVQNTENKMEGYMYAQYVELIGYYPISNKTTTVSISQGGNQMKEQKTSTKNETSSNIETSTIKEEETTTKKETTIKPTEQETTKAKAKKKSKNKKKKDTYLDILSKLAPATKENIYLLAQLIMAEAGTVEDDDLPYKEMACTGQTTANRVVLLGVSLHDVIYMPGQYSTLPEIEAGIKPSEKALKIAKEILEGADGFKGTGIKENLKHFVYYQGCNEGIQVFQGAQRYAIRPCDAYLLQE